MGCNCKKKRVGTQGELARGVNGYLALSCHDNGVAYAGEHLNEQVVLVGKGTPAERPFLIDDYKAASDYAREVNQFLVIQPASLFPAEAMERLFEGLPHDCELQPA